MSDSAFKNWINSSVVKKMGKVFHEVYPSFNQNRFQKISSKLESLELKQRVQLLTHGLHAELPGQYLEDKNILDKVLKRKVLTGFELWPISEYISHYGLEHFDESLELMYQLTQQFTSEFAVRPFLAKDPKRILDKFKTWLKDENVHVRRWISEGSRPLLPWGGKIHSFIKKPETLHLLDHLKYDEELYVRKSVANHLNDITKHHPDLVVKTLKSWLKDSPENHLDKIHWIKRHALRTLIKKGDSGALALMGVNQKIDVAVKKIKLDKDTYALGDYLTFDFTIESKAKKSQRLIVDYAIGFIKSNGSISFKVFKLKTLEIAPGEKITIKKRHSLKKISTMTFYPGKHQLVVQVNGKEEKPVSWNFTP